MNCGDCAPVSTLRNVGDVCERCRRYVWDVSDEPVYGRVVSTAKGEKPPQPMAHTAHLTPR